jgi:hypothetical protein
VNLPVRGDASGACASVIIERIKAAVSKVTFK